jgi:hypothetical protein
MVLQIQWVSEFFGFGLGFARNPIFLWTFYFEIHIHSITWPNPLFWVGLSGSDWINWVCPTHVHSYKLTLMNPKIRILSLDLWLPSLKLKEPTLCSNWELLANWARSPTTKNLSSSNFLNPPRKGLISNS